MSKVTTVGIDLGTTYSEIYKIVNGNPEPCVNEQGKAQTHSSVVVSLKSKGNEIKFATAAEATRTLKKQPRNFIYEVKRTIGRKYSDDYVKRDLHFWPFLIIEGEDDIPYYSTVNKDGQEYLLSAIDVSTQILKTMKKNMLMKRMFL